MDFTGRTHARSTPKTKDRANSIGISRRSDQPHPQTAAGADVFVELGFGAVLRHGQIHTPIAIVIGQSAAALFAIDFDAADRAVDRREAAGPIVFQPETAPAVAAWCFRLQAKEILTQKNVLMSVAIVVGGANAESGSRLRFNREHSGFKIISPIQEKSRFQAG